MFRALEPEERVIPPVDHNRTGGQISRAPSPEEVARAYFREHGDFRPELKPSRFRRWRLRLGILALVVIAAIGALGLLERTGTSSSSASTGTVPTAPTTVPSYGPVGTTTTTTSPLVTTTTTG